MSLKDIKPTVKSLYIEGKDVPELCSMYKLNPSTIYTWIRKESWRSLRDEKMKKFIKSPEILMNMLEKMIESLGENVKDPAALAKSSDAIAKIVKSIRVLVKDKDRLASILFTIGELGKHMNEQKESRQFDEEFRLKFDKLLETFQEKMLLKFNPSSFS